MTVKKYITVILLFTISSVVQAQMVKTVNETTLQPVRNVYIYSIGKNLTAVTDVRGHADLAKFSPGDSLIFQHPSFKRRILLFEEVGKNNFVVKLAKRSVVLEEVYISASKRTQDITEIPQRVAQISSEQIRFSNPQTAADLLQSSGKVFIQKSQLGGGSPMIRGFAANSVMIAVDGIRMNNAIFRSGNLQNVISIDPNILEKAEVLFGPGSVIYGSDALGGVMNFRTMEPELSFSDEETYVRTNSMVRYSSAAHERTVHLDANIGFEKWGLLSSITYSAYDDLRSGRDFYSRFPDWGKRQEYVKTTDGGDAVIQNEDVTIQKYSGYNQLNLMQKIRYSPSKNWDMRYAFHYATTTDIPRYDRLIERENGDTGQLKSAEWYYGPQIWMLNSLNLDLYSGSALYDKISSVFSYQWFQESRNDRKFRMAKLRNREENVHALTASIDFDKHLGEGRELYYGVEGLYNYVQSSAFSRNIETGGISAESTRYPDGGSKYTQLAAYGTYKHELSANLTAIAGARYSHVLLNSRFGDTQFYDFPFQEIEIRTGALNGSLGFTYRPAKHLQFNLNGSTGFRAPNVDDAAKVFDSEPGTVIVPNDDIKPEYSYNLDFTVIKDFENKARLEVNTFYTWLRDAMVRRDFQFNGRDSIMYDGELSKVEAVVNAGKAYIYGISAGLGVELSNCLALDGNITYTIGKDITNDEPMRHVAPLYGQAGITYKAERLRIELYSQFNGEKNISDFALSERSKTHIYTRDGTPAWATVNIKTSYQIHAGVQMNVGMENIFDKHYRPYSSGISAPGRNIILALRAVL